MNKTIAFKGESFEDYLYWQEYDKKTLKRVNQLFKDIDRNGYAGIGKPEPLKHNFQGWWSRRIDEEHRLVYRIEGDEIQVLSYRYHYDD